MLCRERLPRKVRCISFEVERSHRGFVSAFMQKKCHDLLRDHDQMGKHDCYWRAKVRKTTWVPDRDLGLGLREFLLIVEARSDRTIRSRLAPNRPQNEGCLRFELPAGHSRYGLLNASM